LAATEGGIAYEASAANAATGDYPLARYLLVYINKHPNRELDPVTREFVKMLYSKQGQEVVDRDGYVPLPAIIAQRMLEQLGIN
jgi:phosphate transport system substrate-binding protein